ncbi:hypothetical protein I3843_08G123100 [Carya illinoinensis]|nr:hypothetical protein I3843_08G123100 [Carya illinoinensis]
MDGDLSSLCQGLKLIDEEQQEVVVSNEAVLSSVEKSKYYLMICVISDREANKGAFRSTMTRVWQVEGKAIIKDVGWNKFLVEFKEVADKRRILKGRPWSFDKSLLCMEDCEGYSSIKQMKF